MHYLDNCATTFVIEEAANQMKKFMFQEFGNPSSQHKLGINASNYLKNFRKTISDIMGATQNEIVFTSGGTESINTAIFGAAHKNRHIGKHIITTEIEHSAVKSSLKSLEQDGFKITYIKPDKTGHINPIDIENAINNDTILVSIILINNEIGSVQPVEQIGKIIKTKAPKALFHIDAVQGLSKVELKPKKWNCHLMSVSGHKIGAVKGIGALYIRKDVKIRPYILGGGQENGMRSGTEPLPSIASFAAACEFHKKNMLNNLKHINELNEYLKNELETHIKIAQKNGVSDIPHIVNISIEGCKSEVMLRILESENVFVSAGSACSKGKESPVLKAIGLENKRIDSAIRISFSPFNTKNDIDALINGIKKGIKMLKR